jgi:hypothetical protein
VPRLPAPKTTTTNAHGWVDTFVGVVPTCDNNAPALYTITTTSNAVEHETVTGHFATWGGFNENSDWVVNGTATFSIHGPGSDGSTFSVQQMEHCNQRPDGSVNAFFHCQ